MIYDYRTMIKCNIYYIYYYLIFILIECKSNVFISLCSQKNEGNFQRNIQSIFFTFRIEHIHIQYLHHFCSTKYRTVRH